MKKKKIRRIKKKQGEKKNKNTGQKKKDNYKVLGTDSFLGD